MAPTTLPNAGRQTSPRKAKLQGWRPSSAANPACSI
jgi:hypothetical protein